MNSKNNLKNNPSKLNNQLNSKLNNTSSRKTTNTKKIITNYGQIRLTKQVKAYYTKNKDYLENDPVGFFFNLLEKFGDDPPDKPDIEQLD